MMYEKTLARIKRYLLGKEISAIENGDLVLNDGTRLALYESEQDCCAYAEGEWELSDDFHGGITDVKFYTQAIDDPDYGVCDASCELTILHNQNPVAVGNGYANNGNGGFYFSVLSLKVSIDGKTVDDFPILEA